MGKKYKNKIYIGTVLLEVNRWVKPGARKPSILISDWCQRFADEGFDGIELWQNHALLADDEEIQKLKDSPVPVKILNSYTQCENEFAEDRLQIVAAAKNISVEGMKFNFGKIKERHEEYCQNVKKWRATLPKDFRFLCECHGGTTIENTKENLQVVKDTFASLNRDDYEVIIHGFGGDDQSVKDLFKLHEERITHIHANVPTGLDSVETFIRNRIELLNALGFSGSFTIEFTEGVGAEGESAEGLFKNAVRDITLLKKWVL